MKQKALTEASIEAFGKRLEEEEKSPATVQKYLRDVRAFFEYMEGEPLTRERVIRYKQLLQEQYAPSSVNTVLAALNSLFRWLNRHDCLVKTVKIQRQTFRNRDLELSREEYQRLLSAAKRQKKASAVSVDTDHLFHGNSGRRIAVYYAGGGQTGSCHRSSEGEKPSGAAAGKVKEESAAVRKGAGNHRREYFYNPQRPPAGPQQHSPRHEGSQHGGEGGQPKALSP